MKQRAADSEVLKYFFFCLKPFCFALYTLQIGVNACVTAKEVCGVSSEGWENLKAFFVDF